MTDKSIVQQDIEGIYIGNIFTVEADLTLPVKGKYGSAISWSSDSPHLIGETGEVHRPHAGTGDRPVLLTATVCYGDETAVREFQATVLQQGSRVKVVSAVPMHFTVVHGQGGSIPRVAIVKNDDGSLTSIAADWTSQPDWKSLPRGEYTISAEPLAGYPEILPQATVTVCGEADKKTAPVKKLEAFALSDVTVDSGSFYQSKSLMEQYLLSVNDDSMLYNFRQAAGLDTKGALPLTGWDAPESLIKGHTAGHYLSALAFAYSGALGENKAAFFEKLSYMVDELYECRRVMGESGKFAHGFLSGYSEEQFDLLEVYTVYPKIWAPYYTLHKIFAGLLDCYELSGTGKALEICAGLGEWVYNRLEKCGGEKRQKMWSMYIAGEFGGMNEVLARLYRLVPQKEFLKAAEFFNNDKLFVPMEMNIDTLGGMHANQHIPQIIGAMELFEQTGSCFYYELSRNFWKMVTGRHSYHIGGVGEGEMFKQPDCVTGCLSDKNAETCASYNMLKLTKRLFEYEPTSEMMDFYEKALFNHIAASVDRSGPTGGTTYFMPMKPGGAKKYETTSNSCCHGTGMESPVKYQESIYFRDADSLYVNLYIPSTLSPSDEGFSIVQTGSITQSGSCCLSIEGECGLNIKLRLPAWLGEPAVITLNGALMHCAAENGYAVIPGGFHSGDRIEILFSLSLRIEPAPDNVKLAALCYGPLVLAAEYEASEPITLPDSEKLTREIIRCSDEPSFCFNGINLRPISMIAHEKYHLYFAVK